MFLTQGFTPCVGNEARRATGMDGPPDIDALDRGALFALLREKGVRVRLPITNAALRETARRAVVSTAGNSLRLRHGRPSAGHPRQSAASVDGRVKPSHDVKLS